MNQVSNMYVIRDLLAETFFTPFVFPNDAMAKRDFLRLCDDPQSALHASPADYQLIKIGTFDARSGVIASQDHIIVASGVKQDV